MTLSDKPMKIGLIGCGNISQQYKDGCDHYAGIELAFVSDLDTSRASARAAEWGVPKSGSPEQLLADPEVELVVNLTIPGAHAQVDRMILEAGKHVYSEKPLARSVSEARVVLALASERGLRLGCAPDTFLGSSHQTARRAIDGGLIGRPTSATAFMQCRGHEHWHPSPQFYYQAGGGPLLDMGPYYLANLVQLLGPVEKVTGFVGKAFGEREILSKPLSGTRMPVEIDTHIGAVLSFVNGVICTMVMSFDVASHTLPNIQVHGTLGSLDIPDPNGFGGAVRHCAWGQSAWEPLPSVFEDAGKRGAGPQDMARAIRTSTPHRPSAELALHVLEAMEAVLTAGQTGRVVTLTTTCDRPAPREH